MILMMRSVSLRMKIHLKVTLKVIVTISRQKERGKQNPEITWTMNHTAGVL